jgi:hypothetical protein
MLRNHPVWRWQVVGLQGALVGAALVLSGCGGSQSTVRGQVTFKGAPVPQADLLFEGEGGAVSVSGRSDDDGTYYLNYPNGRGMASGRYRVRITQYVLPQGKKLPAGEEGAVLRNDPEKTQRRVYEFEVEVRPGANEHNFELSQGKGVTDLR